MKKLIYTLSALTLMLTADAKAQSILGSIKVKEQSKLEIIAENNNVINLYAAFRENKYPILFSFNASDIPLNSDKKEVVMIQFFTTLKKDGKVIGTIERSPMPFFPGDMFMPVECFDFIPMLSNTQDNKLGKISEIPKGTYQITLEAIGSGVKSAISPVNMLIKF
ncbi:MAG: hypothetical protein ABIP95_05480 [Pelobium sp.]